MKRIEYETNYNKKLLTDCFIHITFEPKISIPENVLSEPILITVADDPSLQIKVITLDVCRLKLGDLLSIHTLPSHGVLSFEFINKWLTKHRGSSMNTGMAIYYHKKVI